MSSWITTRSWFPASLLRKRTGRLKVHFFVYYRQIVQYFQAQHQGPTDKVWIGKITKSWRETLLPWVDFQVVVAGYCVNLNFLLWGSLETKKNNWCTNFYSNSEREMCGHLCTEQGVSHHDCLVLYAQLLHSSSVQLLQQTHDAGLLPRARRTVHQQVREVATLNLKQTFTGFNGHPWHCLWSKVLLCQAGSHCTLSIMC